MKTLLLGLALFFTVACLAQAPVIKWQKSIGSRDDDFGQSIVATSDGCYIVLGHPGSNNEDLSGLAYGGTWLIKLSDAGNIRWQKILTNSNYSTVMIQTSDGSLLIGGDGSIIKTTGTGDVVWKKKVSVNVTSLRQAADGGYIAVGWNDTAVDNHGNVDYYVIKFKSSGSIEWQKSYGGIGEDRVTDIVQTQDGGYIMCGYSYSVTNQPPEDFHGGLLKISSTGSVIWHKTSAELGGSNQYGLAKTNDGNYIVLNDNSPGVTKFTDAGIAIWHKTITATSPIAYPKIIQSLDGGYLIVSQAGSIITNSADGSIIKLDSDGNTLWQKTVGGYGHDELVSICLKDSDYVAAGLSTNANGDVTVNRGKADMWVVKLKNGTTKASQIISFDVIPSKNLLDTDFIIPATTSSDLALTYTSSDTTVATIVAGHKVHLKKEGITNITVLQNGSADYLAATPVSRLLTVTKASQSITFGALVAKTTADPDFSLSGTASSGLGVSYVSSDTTIATIIANNKVHIKKEGTINITASQAGNSVYLAATPVTQPLTITNANQTITFAAIPAKTLADADFSPNATASSGLAVTYSSSDTAIASIVANKVHIKAVGTVNITASQAGNATYAPATPVTRTLTITKANQTISWPGYGSGTRKASDGDFTINATTTSGLPLTYASSDTSIISIINGNTAHVKKTGYVNILITQPGNNVYNQAAHYYGFNLTGTSQTLTITPAPPSGGYSFQLCDIKTVLNGHATSGLPVTYTSSDTSVVGVSHDTLFFRKEGIVDLTAVQPGDLIYSPSNTITTRVKVTGTDTTHYTPAIVVKYSPAINNVCAGETRAITFTAAVNSAGTAPFYQWKKNGKNVGSNSSIYNDPAFKPGTDTVWCVLTSSIKCVTVNNIISNKISITPVPITTPSVTVISYAQQACLNRPITFKASIKNGGAAPLFQWKRNGADVGTNSSTYIDSTMLDRDTVWCIFTTSQACTTISTPIVSNKVVEQVFYNKPVPPSVIIGPASVTPGQLRTGYIVSRVLDVTYDWVVPAGATILTGQGTNQVVVNWGSTGGQVTVRARNACGATDRSILNVTVAPALGIANSMNETGDVKVMGKAELYPNPAANTAYISFTAPAAGKYLVQLTDAQGRILQTKETNAIKGSNRITVDVSHYAQGVYFIKLAGDNKQQSLRLLIQR